MKYSAPARVQDVTYTSHKDNNTRMEIRDRLLKDQGMKSVLIVRLKDECLEAQCGSSLRKGHIHKCQLKWVLKARLIMYSSILMVPSIKQTYTDIIQIILSML